MSTIISFGIIGGIVYLIMRFVKSKTRYKVKSIKRNNLMHKQRIVILISAITGIIGVFLPFMKTFFFSISLIKTQDGTGYIVMGLFIISLIVALIGDKTFSLTKGHLAGTIIPGIIPGVLLLLILIGNSGKDIPGFLTQFEIGFYVIVIASIGILLFGLVLKDNNIPRTEILVNNRKIFCANCGKEYSTEATNEFCEECGNKL